jgi:hypothetical protein
LGAPPNDPGKAAAPSVGTDGLPRDFYDSCVLFDARAFFWRGLSTMEENA